MFTNEEYEKRIDGLFSRHQSFQNAGSAAYKPGLGNMQIIDQLTSHPHRKYRTIHVAGTNGKGSVSNMLASALAATGLKVGLYTSPHILDFRERMRVVTEDGFHLIPKEDVLDFLDKWGETVDHFSLSFFEITTAMAFDWFAREKVDIAVIETGLGGRLDSTNIITPVLSVITSIGLDHCDILGDTLQEIAFEKAGIIKEGVPVVIGETSPETAPIFDRKFKYTNLSLVAQPKMEYADRSDLPDDFEEILSGMDLRGTYQRKNLRTVLCALRLLGVRADADALEHTASRTGFRGRWEELSSSPRMICDIGHNAHGLEGNFRRLEDMLSSGEISDLVLVYGSVADKDVDAVLRLIPSDSRIIFTAASSKRALDATEAAKRYAAVGGRATYEVVPSVAAAVDRAVSLASEMALPLIYIGGSTYVVAEAVSYIEEKKK